MKRVRTSMGATPKSILIVEDEKPLAHALSLKLQHEGFSVVAADSGRQALELTGTNHFDVVVLDLIMPGMDGFQVLEQLRQQTHPPVVFVLSNLSQPGDEQRVIKMGAQKFFVKSNTPLNVVVNEIRQL